MFLEGWERIDIEWNDKEKLKLEGLKNNTLEIKTNLEKGIYYIVINSFVKKKLVIF